MLMGPDMVTRSIERPLEARMRSVAYAAMAYWYYEWDWGEAIAFDGIDAVAEAFGDEHLRAFVDAGVNRWAALEPSASLANRMGPVARAIQRLGSGDPSWRRLERPLESVREAIVNAPRSAAGAYLLDAPSPMIFVDTLYAEPSALAAMGLTSGSQETLNAAVALGLGHSRSLQDERTGLFRHYCDTASQVSPKVHWGRGNGWAMLGLADTLASLAGASVDGLGDLGASFRRACESALRFQTPGGGWRNILDDEASSTESSTSAMIATAFLVGIRSGILEADRFQPAATAAWSGLAHRVDAGGHFTGVSFRPGLNSDPSRYEHVPFAGNLPWGQGAYLRLAAEWLRRDASAGSDRGPDHGLP